MRPVFSAGEEESPTHSPTTTSPPSLSHPLTPTPQKRKTNLSEVSSHICDDGRHKFIRVVFLSLVDVLPWPALKTLLTQQKVETGLDWVTHAELFQGVFSLSPIHHYTPVHSTGVLVIDLYNRVQTVTWCGWSERLWDVWRQSGVL